MLLLLLLGACFTSCLAQTRSFTTSQPEIPTLEPPFSTIQPTPAAPTDGKNSFAFLYTQVESTVRLNETSKSLDLVLNKIASMIREEQPDAVFKLVVKSVTEV